MINITTKECQDTKGNPQETHLKQTIGCKEDLPEEVIFKMHGSKKKYMMADQKIMVKI